MKKTIVYMMTLAALVLALSGCDGSMNDGGVQVTARPQVTVKPEVSSVPEVNDGVVNDDDGVITEDDNGPMETVAPATPTGKPDHNQNTAATPAP